MKQYADNACVHARARVYVCIFNSDLTEGSIKVTLRYLALSAMSMTALCDPGLWSNMIALCDPGLWQYNDNITIIKINLDVDDFRVSRQVVDKFNCYSIVIL